MLNASSLRSVLKDIYGVEDKYLVPISTNWFIPTVDPEDKIGDWIGYRIISKKPVLRAYQSGRNMVKSIKVSFRITFVGPHAEDLADQVLLWEDRTDVTEAFAKQQAEVNSSDRSSLTYPHRVTSFLNIMACML